MFWGLNLGLMYGVKGLKLCSIFPDPSPPLFWDPVDIWNSKGQDFWSLLILHHIPKIILSVTNAKEVFFGKWREKGPHQRCPWLTAIEKKWNCDFINSMD